MRTNKKKDKMAPWRKDLPDLPERLREEESDGDNSSTDVSRTFSKRCYDMQKPSGHQRLLFLSYVTLNCYVTFWTGYVITSDYSRVSSRVTRVKTL